MLGFVRALAGSGGAFAPSTPAALYPVGTAPAVDHAIAAARGAGVDEVVVVTDQEQVRDHVDRAHRDAPVRPVGGDEPVTAMFTDDDPVLVLEGTTVHDVDGVAALAAAAPATGSDERTREATDVPAPAAPAYATGATDAPWTHDSAASFLERLRDAAGDRTVPVAYQLDVRRPWEYLEATGRVLETLDRAIEGDVHDAAECRGRVRVESGATVDAGSVVRGPAVVCSGAEVGPNAHVRGATLVGPGARVGHAAEVKNAVLMRDARVPHQSYVGDSVLGPDVNVGAGSNVANLRHDGRPVRVAHDGTRVSTGRRKFGAVIGEGARLGIGTQLDAGVTLDPGVGTTPGETVLRDRERAE